MLFSPAPPRTTVAVLGIFGTLPVEPLRNCFCICRGQKMLFKLLFCSRIPKCCASFDMLLRPPLCTSRQPKLRMMFSMCWLVGAAPMRGLNCRAPRSSDSSIVDHCFRYHTWSKESPCRRSNQRRTHEIVFARAFFHVGSKSCSHPRETQTEARPPTSAKIRGECRLLCVTPKRCHSPSMTPPRV